MMGIQEMMKGISLKVQVGNKGLALSIMPVIYRSKNEKLSKIILPKVIDQIQNKPDVHLKKTLLIKQIQETVPRVPVTYKTRNINDFYLSGKVPFGNSLYTTSNLILLNAPKTNQIRTISYFFTPKKEKEIQKKLKKIKMMFQKDVIVNEINFRMLMMRKNSKLTQWKKKIQIFQIYVKSIINRILKCEEEISALVLMKPAMIMPISKMQNTITLKLSKTSMLKKKLKLPNFLNKMVEKLKKNDKNEIRISYKIDPNFVKHGEETVSSTMNFIKQILSFLLKYMKKIISFLMKHGMKIISLLHLIFLYEYRERIFDFLKSFADSFSQFVEQFKKLVEYIGIIVNFSQLTISIIKSIPHYLQSKFNFIINKLKMVNFENLKKLFSKNESEIGQNHREKDSNIYLKNNKAKNNKIALNHNNDYLIKSYLTKIKSHFSYILDSIISTLNYYLKPNTFSEYIYYVYNKILVLK